jgi:hypothetical protein
MIIKKLMNYVVKSYSCFSQHCHIIYILGSMVTSFLQTELSSTSTVIKLRFGHTRVFGSILGEASDFGRKLTDYPRLTPEWFGDY